MDEFDKRIKDSRHDIVPSRDFVDRTMSHIAPAPRRGLFRPWLWAPALAGGVVVIAVIFLVLPSSRTTMSQSTAHSGGVSTTSATSTNPTTASIPSGSDDASLNNEINAVTAAMTQVGTDQTAADTAINDSANQVAIPTN